MNRKWAVLAGILLTSLNLFAGEATDQLQKTVTAIVDTLKDEGLKSNAELRRQKISDLLGNRFDYQEMSRKVLGKEWKQANESQQKEFIQLFRKLLERSYISKIEAYTNEKVVYPKEISLDQEKLIVETIIQSQKGDIPINYNLHHKDTEWKIYDVTIEGVGLIKNYRTQFKTILDKENFDALLKKLKENDEKKEY